MTRKPRSATAPLITPDLMTKAILQGLAIFAAAFGSYLYLTGSGWNVDAARTFTIVVLGFANLFLVYVNKSDKEITLLDMFRYKDQVVIYVNLGILAMLAIILYLPAANSVAKTMPMSLYQLLAAIAVAAVATFWWELVKLASKICSSFNRTLSGC